MKPYLLLVLAISLAVTASAQKNEIKQTPITVKQISATGTLSQSSQNKAVVDTSSIIANIDWNGFLSCHGWVALHQTISDPGTDVKEINWFGGCNFPIFRGLDVGAVYIVSFKDDTGLTGYSQPVTVRAGFPPAIAFVSLPH